MSRRVTADEVRLLFFSSVASTDVPEHISGFSGSAGTAVVTLDKAALSTDGRYFNQASKQLDQNWLLLKQGIEEVPTWQDWYDNIRSKVRGCMLTRVRTAEQAEDDKTVGVDPTVITACRVTFT